MKFYIEWQNYLFDIEKNKKYTKKFLLKDPETLEVFNNGSKEDLIKVCKFLLNIPLSNFIYCIDEDRACTPEMIIQYSNLEHGLITVPRVIRYSQKELTYAELGKMIIKAKEIGACKKYGENHAKLASELSMVKLERKNAIEVSNTAFGDFSVELSNDDRLELVKRLLLRNEFIQKIIYLAKKDFVIYMDIACQTLSETTAIRRKSNNKQIVSLILGDNEIFNNIVW